MIVGTAQTDANGFYSFGTDSTVSTAPVTITKTLSLAGITDGDLTSVELSIPGTMASTLETENLSVNSPATIVATPGGQLSVAIPTAGVKPDPRLERRGRGRPRHCSVKARLRPVGTAGSGASVARAVSGASTFPRLSAERAKVPTKTRRG